MSQLNLLVKTLKEKNQDFEFYPTTDEMIKTIIEDSSFIKIGRSHSISILDIGAGNGKVLSKFSSIEYHYPFNKTTNIRNNDVYAIEKSTVLIEQMPTNISIVGTDFYDCNLSYFEMDCIFCNPPYSEYEEWTTKIISEATASLIFLIVPNRWSSNEKIKNVLAQNSYEAKVIYNWSYGLLF